MCDSKPSNTSRRRFRRLKIKSPAFVALHHMGSTAGEQVKRDVRALSAEDKRMRARRLLEIARCREGDEFLACEATSFRTSALRIAVGNWYGAANSPAAPLTRL